MRKLPVALLAASLLMLAASPPPAPAGEQPVTRAALENGLRVVIVRDPLAPVATEVLNYLVGSDEAPAGFPGMAHAQEHMMFRSAEGLTAGQQADIAAALGGDFNADTQQAVTQYFFTVPAEDLDVALHIEAARMSGALDLQEEWAQERGAIEQEVSQDLSNSFYRFYSTGLANIFKGTPYDHDALGTRPSFDKTTGAMLKKFHDAWYAPNNAVLVITGDIDPEATLATVKEIFENIPKRRLPPRPAFNFGPLKPHTLVLDSDFPVPIVLLMFRMPGYESPDWAAAEIASDVLSSQRGTLYELQASGRALESGFEYQGLPKAGFAFGYLAIAPNASTDAALGTLKDVLNSYRKNGVPAELVDAAKRKEIAQSKFKLNSIDGLAETWSQALAVEGRRSPDDDDALIAKVTKADVDRVLQKYLVAETATVGILKPKPAGAPSSSAGFGGKESFAPKELKPAPFPSWAQKLARTPGVPKSNVSPSDMMLANGIRLIVQPESISPTVTVRGEIRRNPDLQEPPGKDGVDAVLGGLFSYGTTSLDRLAFQKALDDIAADESGGASFSLAVQGADFDRGMQLLADNVLHPALPQAAFAIVQTQTAQSLQGQLTSPDYLASRALSTALLPKNDPALRQATPETVGTLTLQDAKAYYASVFRPDMTTIVVIGDVTPELAKSEVEKWFGAWKAAGPRPNVVLPPVPLNKPSSADVPATGHTQSTVTLAEQLGLTRFDPDYYALELGNAVLGGGFYSTRFYRDLRLNSGLVYYVQASLDARKTRATYSVKFGSDPENVSKARSIIDRDLSEIATVDPSADELGLAKTSLVRDITLSEASEAAIASGLLRRAILELPLDEPTKAAKIIVGLTPDKVKAAFAKWIDPSRFVEIVEGPAPK